ncbi:hypothetical protein DQ04_16071010, partial [Trypanosoma grayi]|uniref:hypothetical protein n=1 Tax=Trypanosoma grayi TaxID=71804 RepID=UPI0004F40CA6
MDASNKRDFRHFVLLQHGVLGTPADVDALICHLFHENERRGRGCRAELSSNTTKVLALPLDVTRTTNKHGGCIFTKGNLVCFAPGSNKFLGTNRSTCSCAKRVLREFLPVFSEWLDAARRADDSLLCFSCVGHSFGGLIMREMLYLLLTATELEGWESGLFAAVLRVREELAELNVTLENFVTIATPHCGVSECLLTPVYCGAWVLAKTCAPSMQELLLMD